jgi:hypothetical protein
LFIPGKENMNTLRLFLVVLAVLASESALAACPNPLRYGSGCCDFMVASDGRRDSAVKNTLLECRITAAVSHDRIEAAEGREFLSEQVLGPYLPNPPNLPGGYAHYDIDRRYCVPNPFGDPPCIPFETLTATYTYMATPPLPPPVACSILDLPPIPDTADACTKSLEANKGGYDPALCPPVPVMTRPLGEPCWREKVNSVGYQYSPPTSTIRTAAYNKHLQEVWSYYDQHKALVNDPEQYQACARRRAVVEAELGKHKLARVPADQSKHLTGRAFDSGQVGTLLAAGHNPMKMLRTTTPNPACSLIWGGTWRGLEYDPVHFHLNVP